MGLTIHYSFKSRVHSIKGACRKVEQMRQLALDLPFEEVSDLIDLADCNYNNQTDHRGLCIQAQESEPCPWHPRIYVNVIPTHIVAFNVDPGPGCETANIGLRCIGGKWTWGSFCKTQYASDPRAGGMANLLRCHISLVTLLERIGKLVTVEIDDEGKYGPSHYSDDWKEARAAGREPTYTWHDGEYDVIALAKEVGSWNEMIAAMAGIIDGEHLEFRGQKQIEPFLDAMSKLAGQERAKHAGER